MIDLKNLAEADKNRPVVYHRKNCNREVGTLSSWNDSFVFVQFSAPNGEACSPADVSFVFPPSPMTTP